MTLEAGRELNHYQILELIGEGGMGEVYRAKDRKLGRDVAIKVLPDELARDEQRLARFEREARVLAALNHPGIASIYGLEESDGTHYLVLELVPGETLEERLAFGLVPVEEVLRIAIKIADAVERAHERGIIHRDLKPANIKVTPEGEVVVLDFGLAKTFELEREPVSDPSSAPTKDAGATRTGVIVGTVSYMSPEQARGETVDRRSDIFSFGSVLYEMLTGRRAFAGATASDVLAAILTAEPDWTLLPAGLAPEIRRLLRRCLEKDRRARQRDIGDVRLEMLESMTAPVDDAVEAAAEGEGATAKRVGPAVLVAMPSSRAPWSVRSFGI